MNSTQKTICDGCKNTIEDGEPVIFSENTKEFFCSSCYDDGFCFVFQNWCRHYYENGDCKKDCKGTGGDMKPDE